MDRCGRAVSKQLQLLVAFQAKPQGEDPVRVVADRDREATHRGPSSTDAPPSFADERRQATDVRPRCTDRHP